MTPTINISDVVNQLGGVFGGAPSNGVNGLDDNFINVVQGISNGVGSLPSAAQGSGDGISQLLQAASTIHPFAGAASILFDTINSVVGGIGNWGASGRTPQTILEDYNRDIMPGVIDRVLRMNYKNVGAILTSLDDTLMWMEAHQRDSLKYHANAPQTKSAHEFGRDYMRAMHKELVTDFVQSLKNSGATVSIKNVPKNYAGMDWHPSTMTTQKEYTITCTELQFFNGFPGDIYAVMYGEVAPSEGGGLINDEFEALTGADETTTILDLPNLPNAQGGGKPLGSSSFTSSIQKGTINNEPSQFGGWILGIIGVLFLFGLAKFTK